MNPPVAPDRLDSACVKYPGGGGGGAEGVGDSVAACCVCATGERSAGIESLGGARVAEEGAAAAG